MAAEIAMRLNSQQRELLTLVVARWGLGSLDELVRQALAEAGNCAGAAGEAQ